MKTKALAIAAALAPVGRGRVLWADLDPIEELDVARGANRGAIGALSGEGFDAVVLGAAGGDARAIAKEARACVRAGGVIAWALPLEREGVKAAAQRAALVFDRRARPRPLEDVCEALLECGCTRLEVIEIDGARGEAVVWGMLAGAQASGW